MNRKSVGLCGVLLVCLLSHLVAAANYSVSGSVGVGGATVSLAGRTATSNADGSFTIPAVPNGTYPLTAAKSGCSFNTVSVTVSNGNVTGRPLQPTCAYSVSGSVSVGGATVALAGRTATSNTDGSFTILSVPNGTSALTAAKAGCSFNTVSVTVSNANVTGKNVNAACAYSVSGYVGLPNVLVSLGGRTSTSDTSGSYLLTGVPNGSYVVNASAVNCMFASTTAVVSNANVTGKNLVPSCSYTISGSAGKAGVSVVAGGKTSTSDANGNYVIAGLSNGSYAVSATAQSCTFISMVAVVNNASVTGKNLAPSCSYTISGTVGQPNISVSAGGRTSVSDASGYYAITGLSNGSYSVSASSPNCTFTPTTAVISNANVAGKNLAAACTFAIVGAVGRANVSVSAGGKTSTSDASGSYAINGLSNGTYVVSGSAPGCTFTSTTAVVTNANATGRNLTPSCTYTLSGNTGAASVKIIVGNPLINVTGSGLPGVGSAQGALNSLVIPMASTVSNSSGHYSISGLSVGTYPVTASKDGCQVTQLPSSVILGPNSATANFTTTCTFAISGTLTGDVASGATITVTSAWTGTGQVVPPVAMTGSNYTIQGLAAGSYVLTPSAPGCYFTRPAQTIQVPSVTGVLPFNASCPSLTSATTTTVTRVVCSATDLYGVVHLEYPRVLYSYPMAYVGFRVNAPTGRAIADLALSKKSKDPLGDLVGPLLYAAYAVVSLADPAALAAELLAADSTDTAVTVGDSLLATQRFFTKDALPTVARAGWRVPPMWYGNPPFENHLFHVTRDATSAPWPTDLVQSEFVVGDARQAPKTTGVFTGCKF